MEEIWIKDMLLAFDGRVVEIFGFPGSESLRFHIANLKLEITGPDRKGRHSVQLKPLSRHTGGCLFEVREEDWPAAEAYLDNVTRHMPPVPEE